MRGANTFQVEILGISKQGFWLFLEQETEELFISFVQFPWFAKASVEKIFCVERPLLHHLYWSELDIDLHIDSIRHPENFPLISCNS
jgi:hypothetical protein